MAWQSRAAQRRATGRERVLAEAGSALLAAPDADAARRVAAAATARLLGLDPPAEGVEVRAGDEPVPAEARAAMDSLRAQVAVALERAELAAELARRASVDPLTGLANRTARSRRLREALAAERVGAGAPALLLLDLDDFKTINDSLGHSSGDEVLRVVAERLRSCLQPGDLAARLGGDEFAVLVPRVGGEAEVVALGERLAAVLRTPVTVAGREVLARASVGVPDRGLVMPGEFVALAEDTGLIVPIGRWVLHAACQAARDWQRRFPLQPHPFLSVNLSVRQLQQPDLLEDVAGALDASGLDPGELMLEITESVLVTDQETMLERLGGLRAPGVHLAIDDFGTGYSALAYLKTLPVDTLKLAKPFVDGLLGRGRGGGPDQRRPAHRRPPRAPGDRRGRRARGPGPGAGPPGLPPRPGFHFARPLDQFAVEALLVAEQARRPSRSPRLPVV